MRLLGGQILLNHHSYQVSSAILYFLNILCCQKSSLLRYNSLIAVDKKRMKKDFSFVFQSGPFSIILFHTKSMTF